jgi:DnaK suppressor protein
MSDQNARFIEQQRIRLEALREQLLSGEHRRIVKEQAFQEEHGNEPQDFGDKGANMAQNEIYQALHDVDEQRLRNIERALQKIEEGTYGLSDLSGKPIPRARLEASPEAILTVAEEQRKESE